ncbi:MAG: HAMP domain-containing sensor histidine kinase [Ilumatobacteraceae bacterium]|nr:HAMP domain-containing sensor histidine kinase [Ilumatobacteraceae bacterium]
MTLRTRLLVAGGACLLVVIVAFFGVERRQEQVLFDQLDTQLTLVADQVSRFPAFPTRPELDPVSDTGELYVGAVANGGLITVAAPASTPGLVPDLDDVRRAPRDVPVTIGTSDSASDMRVIVQDFDGVALVIGQSTGPIDDAIRSLRVSGLVSIAAIGAFAVVLGSWVNRLGIRPIRAATEVARAITAGRRDERVPESSGNTEAATLGSAMNLMLDTTADTEDRLRAFVADASHELRTPLTTLMGYADLHRQGLLTSDEAVDDAMRRIRAEATRMSRIVEHLLLLANLDEGEVPIEPGIVDVGQLLDDVATDARVVQPARPITVDIPAPVEVSADPDRLLQAVSILVTNALTHTPASAALSLGAETDGEAVVIRVADRGPGIPADHLGRVFDRFYRVDGASSPTHGGSGLGLAIAKSLVEAHGGSLDVESVVGCGSTFIIRVPAVHNDLITEGSLPEEM